MNYSQTECSVIALKEITSIWTNCVRPSGKTKFVRTDVAYIAMNG